MEKKKKKKKKKFTLARFWGTIGMLQHGAQIDPAKQPQKRKGKEAADEQPERHSQDPRLALFEVRSKHRVRLSSFFFSFSFFFFPPPTSLFLPRKWIDGGIRTTEAAARRPIRTLPDQHMAPVTVGGCLGVLAATEQHLRLVLLHRVNQRPEGGPTVPHTVAQRLLRTPPARAPPQRRSFRDGHAEWIQFGHHGNLYNNHRDRM